MLAEKAGLKIEEHMVSTPDGFYLSLFHVVGKVGEEEEEGSDERGHPVLLLHGLMMDSEVFVCSQKSSLAYFLYSEGLDVWIGNNRGNRYSHKHLKLSPSDKEYWNFSMDEFARYDVPSFINHVSSSLLFFFLFSFFFLVVC